MGQFQAKRSMFIWRPHRNPQERERKREPVEPTADASAVTASSAMPARNEKFRYFDPSHSGRILSGLHKQWIEDRFLDVTIKIGDENIRAHKSVLLAFSPYFEARFGGGMSDASLDVVSLHDINADAVRMLINFAYTGSVEITPENVQDLLSASSYLCIDSVIEACGNYLVQNLSVENCIDIHELACTFGQLKMRQGVENFMISHFEELLRDDHFLQMSHETLRALLEKDELIVMENKFSLSEAEQEKKLVETVLRFAHENPEIDGKHLMLLLSRGIRLLLLSGETIESLKSSEVIVRSPECLDLVNRILCSDMSNEERERWERPRFFSVEYENTRVLANVHSVVEEAPTEPFDDSKLFKEGQCIYIVGMKLYTRLWDGHEVIGGLEIFYNTGKSVHHGLGSSADTVHNEEFHLGPDERIIAVNTQTGWMVDQLEFKTNKGNTFGPYGGDGGGKYNFLPAHAGGYLAFISGNVDVTQGAESIRRIRFVWAFPKSSVAKQSKPKRTSSRVAYRADC